MESLILKEVLSWCPTAISAVLLFVVLYLIKKINGNEKAHAEHAKNLQNIIEAKLASLKTDTAKILDEHARRISNLELEYVRRDTFYRELGGWKDDINRLSGQFMEFTKNIIELWKDRKEQ